MLFSVYMQERHEPVVNGWKYKGTCWVNDLELRSEWAQADGWDIAIDKICRSFGISRRRGCGRWFSAIAHDFEHGYLSDGTRIPDGITTEEYAKYVDMERRLRNEDER